MQGSSAEHVYYLTCRSVPRSVSYGRYFASLQYFRARGPGVILLAADRASALSSGQSSGLQPSFYLEVPLLSAFLLDKETGSRPEDGPFCCSHGISAHTA